MFEKYWIISIKKKKLIRIIKGCTILNFFLFLYIFKNKFLFEIYILHRGCLNVSDEGFKSMEVALKELPNLTNVSINFR